MASERAKADEENLRQAAFEKGEWANQPPTDLDVDYDYDLLSGALGTEGAPLMSITAETLLALSFCVDELAQALSGKMDDVLTRWESALTSRIGYPLATGAAADNARAAAETAAMCRLSRRPHQQRRGRPSLRRSRGCGPASRSSCSQATSTTGRAAARRRRRRTSGSGSLQSISV